MMIAVLLLCAAIDGDTLRCGDERYRLLGIDAPELSRCREGRQCVSGDPVASKANLSRLISGKQVRIEVVGKDRYGRGLALASVDGVDLSCAQLKSGNALYIKAWDNGGQVAARCG